MKKTIILLILLFITHLSFAVDQTNSYIVESENLINMQKYDTAFEYLTNNEKHISNSDFVVQKVKILLNYFVHSTMHQMFALKDIPENESVYDYRGREGSFQYVMYKPDEAIEEALKSDQSNGELYFWLGQYYYEVLEKYNEQWLVSNDELRLNIIENYELAVLNNYSDMILHSNLGQIYLQTSSYDKARENLIIALKYDDSNPGYNHNLAVANLHLKEHSDALDYAKKAIQFYDDDYYKADSCYLAGIIAINLQMYDQSIDFLNIGKDLVPDQYRFYDKLIDLYLYKKEFNNAKINSKDLFNLYPTDPSVMGNILNYYNNYKVLEEVVIVIDELLTEIEESESLGNLYYNKALTSDALGNRDNAVEELLIAKLNFQEVFTDDHQVFQAIDTLINQMK